jgi:hypothetical protein
MPGTTSQVSEDQAGRNADALLTLRAGGQDSLDHCPPDTLTYGQSATQLNAELARLTAAAGRLGVGVRLNVDTLGKMRRVAQEYTPEQVADLAARVRMHRSRFSTSHLIRLLALGDRKRRDALEENAVRGSWPLSLLERHVQIARRARRAGAGRNPQVPAGGKHRLVVLEGLCLKWVRWTGRAAARLPPDVRTLVEAADAAVGAVQDALAKHLPRAAKAAGAAGKTATAEKPRSAGRRPGARRAKPS